MAGLPDETGADPADTRPEPEATRPVKEVQRGLREHLHARIELLSLELAEARGTVARKGALGVGLLLAAVLAYLLLLVAAIGFMGRWFTTLGSSMGWELATLLAGLLHAGGAALCFLLLRRKPTPPLFEYTRAELHKDREWLRPDPTSNGSKNSS